MDVTTSTKMERFWEERTNNNNLQVGMNLTSCSESNASNNLLGQSVGSSNEYERNLNFTTATISPEDSDYYPKKKTVRDPLSHRIIEKRRRDRMNNCLADLARLLPPQSLRKGRGRIEKTEIVELAIKQLRHLQSHPCPLGDKCEYNYIARGSRPPAQDPPPKPTGSLSSLFANSTFSPTSEEHFRVGFHECMSETMHFLVEDEGMYPGDPLCLRILKHLRTCVDSIAREHFGNEGKMIQDLRSDTVIKKEPLMKALACDPLLNDFNNASSASSASNGNGSSPSTSNGGQDADSPVESLSFPHPGLGESGRNSNPNNNMDYEGENSCCSIPLSMDNDELRPISGRSSKPPIPTITFTTSTHNSSSELNANSRLSDEGHEHGIENNSGTLASASQYKFKNNIKERFVADHNTDPSTPTQRELSSDNPNDAGNRTMPKPELEEGPLSSIKTSHLSSKSVKQSPVEPVIKVSTSTDDNTVSVESQDTIKVKLPIPNKTLGEEEMSNGIPAFALLEKGLFYVPLTIDKAYLAPYFGTLNSSNATPQLHPVTINVCFLLPNERPSFPGSLSSMVPIPKAVTPVPVTPLPLVTPKTEPKSLQAGKVHDYSAALNRLSASYSNRQYNVNSVHPQHYPVSSYGTGGPILTSSKVLNQFHPTLSPGYYPTDHSAFNGNGYTSSSSSGSSNGNGRVRKRSSMGSVSPMSGSSCSLGYHSFNDKYSPTQGQGQCQDTLSFPTYHAHPLHPGYGMTMTTSGHLFPFRDEHNNITLKHTFGDNRGQSCSPVSKRVKKAREKDDLSRVKSLPIGLPVISLPSNR